MDEGIVYSDRKEIVGAQLRELFASIGWDSAKYPEEHLERAMLGSDAVCTAWVGDRLVGMINALSDGCLTVYIHYFLVRPEFQGRGIGKELMRRLLSKYAEVPVKVLVADPKAVTFYEQFSFVPDQGCRAMFLKKAPPPAAS